MKKYIIEHLANKFSTLSIAFTSSIYCLSEKIS